MGSRYQFHGIVFTSLIIVVSFVLRAAEIFSVYRDMGPFFFFFFTSITHTHLFGMMRPWSEDLKA